MMRGREATECSTCSPTAPSGDTPCLTAGDARRVNPWSGDAVPPPTPAVSHSIHFCPSELLPPRFQCDAAGVGVSFVHFPTGSLSLIALVSPRGYAWCASSGGVVGAGDCGSEGMAECVYR